ncbi:uncharacterized protein DFL_000025 [Arthrobotrys flagrans]|uniref:J domain-containing protein n=1 Tax=Arthrobotrys flagrans TaxID=97331 RepID=A0A437AD15_ARTFL|nr:hypothetical protein DFL_000025 [Arthrobotrys flagrans]
MSNHYELLGVPMMATPAEIRAAWKTKALELHPDKNGGSVGAKEAFQKLQAAYEVLSDPEKREQYDRAAAAEARTSSVKRGAPYTASEGLFHQKWKSHEFARPSVDNSRREVADLQSKISDLRRRMAKYEDWFNRLDEERKVGARTRFRQRKEAGGRMYPTDPKKYTEEDREVVAVKKMRAYGVAIAGLERELRMEEIPVRTWDDDEVIRVREWEELEKLRQERAAEKARRGHAAKEQAGEEEEGGRGAQLHPVGVLEETPPLLGTMFLLPRTTKDIHLGVSEVQIHGLP